jgi:hypothetical protein
VQFHYHTDPARLALISAALLLILAVFVPLPLLRLALVSLASGPLVWALFQRLRRGRTLRLYDDYLLIQRSLSGRVLRIPYADIRGAIPTRRGGLGLLYQIAPQQPAPPSPEGKRSLLDARPEPDARPRQRVVITAKVDNIAALVEAIHARLSAQEPPLPAMHVRMLVSRRRRRDFFVVVLAILGIPLYVAALTRVLMSFR